jgi:hypothetical protein
LWAAGPTTLFHAEGPGVPVTRPVSIIAPLVPIDRDRPSASVCRVGTPSWASGGRARYGRLLPGGPCATERRTRVERGVERRRKPVGHPAHMAARHARVRDGGRAGPPLRPTVAHLRVCPGDHAQHEVKLIDGGGKWSRVGRNGGAGRRPSAPGGPRSNATHADAATRKGVGSCFSARTLSAWTKRAG